MFCVTWRNRLHKNGLFQKEIVTPFLLKISMKKFQGVRAKVVGIPGGYAKIRGKNVDFQGGQCKKIDNLKMGVQFFSGKPKTSFQKSLA